MELRDECLYDKIRCGAGFLSDSCLGGPFISLSSDPFKPVCIELCGHFHGWWALSTCSHPCGAEGTHASDWRPWEKGTQLSLRTLVLAPPLGPYPCSLHLQWPGKFAVLRGFSWWAWASGKPATRPRLPKCDLSSWCTLMSVSFPSSPLDGFEDYGPDCDSMRVTAFLDIPGQDNLPPLTRLEKYAFSDNVFNR